VIVWHRLYDTPERHGRITESERAYLAEHLVHSNPAEGVRWLRLLAVRQIWGLLAAKFFSDAAWYFFLFWLPKYLADVRGLNVAQIGYFAWIPYVFMGVGSLAGGWLSSYLIRRGMSLDASRKIALGMGACIVPAAMLVASSPLSLAIGLLGVAMMGHMFWATILQTLPTDMFPSSMVGSVAGLMGATGSFGGMFFNVVIGEVLGRQGGYAPVFMMAGLMHPLSFLLLLVVVRRVAPCRIAD
jgi:ACS family hexuronate transporter-like MFS transporter